MRSLLAIILIPTGLAVTFARPFLTFGYVAFLISFGFAYLNPGWADPEFTNRLMWITASLFSARYAGDLLQGYIERNL